MKSDRLAEGLVKSHSRDSRELRREPDGDQTLRVASHGQGTFLADERPNSQTVIKEESNSDYKTFDNTKHLDDDLDNLE